MADYNLVRTLLVQARALIYEASTWADDYTPEGEDITYNLQMLVRELDYWIEKVEKKRRGQSAER